MPGRRLQLSDGDGVRRRRWSRVVRTASVGGRRDARLRKGGGNGDWRRLRPMDRLRRGFHLRRGPMSKALLRARLDGMQQQQRALPAPAPDPAGQQQRRRERCLPLLSGQSMRRARSFVVHVDRGEHHLPDRRPDGSHGLSARGHRERCRSLSLQGGIHVRGRRLPQTLPRGGGRWRAFVPGNGRDMCALQPRSAWRWRMHAHLVLPPRDIRSIHCARTSVISRL